MEQNYDGIQIESTLPKPWEEEVTFNDILYDWMSRAPWLMISVVAHGIIAVILLAIPWEVFDSNDAKKIQTSIEQAPEEVFEEPPEEEPEPIEEEEIEEPVLKDAEISDHNEDETDQYDSTEGDPDFISDTPFDSDQFNSIIGIGGGAGGKFGNRFGGRRNLRSAGGSGTEQALKDGLDWLAKHQDEDGRWAADDYTDHCPPDDQCREQGDGGEALHDVGMTGLCLLAFLGDGNTTSKGEYKDNVARGITFLKSQQDPDTGLLGDDIGHGFMYNHAIGALAICEAYYFSKSPLIKRTAQKAINFITRARNPYTAWRYDAQPTGDNDTSVTGWMVFALKSAEEAGLKVDKEAFAGALTWIDEVTDVNNGRVGYDSIGSESSRITGINEHFPRDKGEAMTAVGLLCRFFLGQDPDDNEVMEKHAELMRDSLPVWDPDGYGNDMYYWYYGTYAMFQMGGSRFWKPWNESMKPAVLKSQRKEGHLLGSWDPVGPWGYAGGRVYSTACMVLCLEVYFRYAKVLGAR